MDFCICLKKLNNLKNLDLNDFESKIEKNTNQYKIQDVLIQDIQKMVNSYKEIIRFMDSYKLDKKKYNILKQIYENEIHLIVEKLT